MPVALGPRAAYTVLQARLSGELRHIFGTGGATALSPYRPLVLAVLLLAVPEAKGGAVAWMITRRGGRSRCAGSLGSPTVHRLHDRSKTVVRGHVPPRATVPLHPETAAFGAHSRFVIDVLAAARPGLTHASRRRA